MTATTLIAGSKLKALMRFAADQDVRYYLVGIYFDPKGFAVATDGNTLMAVKIGSFAGDGFIVPSAVIEAALKSKKGMAKYRYTFCVSGAEFDGVAYTPIDAKYPDWQRVMPTKVSGEHGVYNSQYLERARKALEDCADGAHKQCVFIAPNGSGPGVIEHGADDISIIIMSVARPPAVSPVETGAKVAAFLKAAA